MKTIVYYMKYMAYGIWALAFAAWMWLLSHS